MHGWVSPPHCSERVLTFRKNALFPHCQPRQQQCHYLGYNNWDLTFRLYILHATSIPRIARRWNVRCFMNWSRCGRCRGLFKNHSPPPEFLSSYWVKFQWTSVTITCIQDEIWIQYLPDKHITASLNKKIYMYTYVCFVVNIASVVWFRIPGRVSKGTRAAARWAPLHCKRTYLMQHGALTMSQLLAPGAWVMLVAGLLGEESGPQAPDAAGRQLAAESHRTARGKQSRIYVRSELFFAACFSC
jgi:hypothetical protein